MKVKLADIKRHGRKYCFELPPPTDDKKYRVGFTGGGTPVCANFLAEVSSKEFSNSDQNSNPNVKVSGNITGTVEVLCSRCGSAIEKNIDIAVERLFMPALDHKITADEHQLSEEDLSVEFYQNEIIDLKSLLEEELLLEMSVFFLCDENCKGKCPDCGKKDEICECSNDSHGRNNYIKGLEKLRE